MFTDVDTAGGGQLGGRSRGERQVRCRLPFRQVKSSQVSLSSPVPSGRGALRAAVRERTVSFAHTRQSHHTPASRLCAQTGRSPPSGRAGEPGGTTGGGGAREREIS